MRIAIVDDMPIAVEALRRIILTVPNYEIAWIAHNGEEAVAKCAQDTPDLILMNLIMPVMDGIEATRRIMSNSPCAILIVTSSLETHSGKVFEAMGYGALDAINTPSFGAKNAQGGSELLTKLSRIAQLVGKSKPNPKAKIPQLKSTVPPLLAIGSSTGGPQALAAILSLLPENFNAAVAIVQHVDAEFAPGLAEWLNNQSKLPVSLATANAHLEVGKVVIAATNDHLILQPNLRLKYTQEPRDYPYHPSVDRFFHSVAEHWVGKGVGVLLTGMGKDGAKGLLALRGAGWHTIAQDRASCVVYGMPKAAIELDAAVEVLPLEAIAKSCVKHLPH
ncbi:MAG TPA: chemotaxis response regulator protein-glutamate methylesterase [Cyanobacteria bacterium UBA11369]|nr:chemotaxis response regulator protein-glutamate methylesterase [Cyanobacteria bacterium UBA11371]HBE30403.1 chemotaxis response regulator protein-glutamate methylesterase [Cyanobacteria bacterium UBA11368]HBE48798.1 chemotaxis response regulator protein-glutamate methylesterase [Cyanobacteria bacterium UBA11369]